MQACPSALRVAAGDEAREAGPRDSLLMSVLPDGERVRSLREERGWTQDGLAGRAVIDVQTLRRIERGGRVRRRSLLRVAQALGLELEALQRS